MKYIYTIKNLGILILVGLVSTGCGSYNVAKYNESAKNIKTIKSIKTQINIGKFTSKEKGEGAILCRAAGYVGTADEKPFAQYIKSALISELKRAGKFNPKSKITISGHLEETDFNANIGTSNWIFKLKVISNNSKSIVVNTKYEFEGTFIADYACTYVARAFVPAVQKLISDIVKHPGFGKLL